MNTKRRMSLELRIALDKLAASLPTTVVTYSPVDKAAAKGVLDRLLDLSTRREVSYIRVIPREVGES